MWDDEKTEEIDTEQIQDVENVVEETQEEPEAEEAPVAEEAPEADTDFMKKFEDALNFYAKGGKSPDVAARALKEYQKSK